MMPLQAPLLAIGARGMPVDEDRVAEHKVECQAKVAEATKILVEAGEDMLAARAADLAAQVKHLEWERDGERAAGGRAFSRAKELSSLRTKLKAATAFNPDSAPQRTALLYDWYGLPPIKNKGAKGLTSDDTAIGDLINRLERGTIKPKRLTIEEVLPVLRAMVEVKRWGILDRTFLRPELR
jgi:hypothetical protein